MKHCNKCGLEKDKTDFYILQDTKGCRYLNSICKECSKKKSMEWARKNKEKANASVRKWRIKYPERERASCKKWHDNNPDRVRYLARKVGAKRRSTPKGKLRDNISCLMYQSLKGSKAGRCWEDLVGYTVDQLKQHLEKRFTPEMNWGNYGSYWHIDHKIPIAVFNFERPEDIDFKLCWSIKNLQPLEARQNILKRDKLSKPFQPSLALGA